jgi:hypothetical protein
MDQITIDYLAFWFIVVGRRLDLLPPPRARFVQPRVSVCVELTESHPHNVDSVNTGFDQPPTDSVAR